MLKNTLTTIASTLLIISSMTVNAGNPGKSEHSTKEDTQSEKQDVSSESTQDNSSAAEVSIIEFSSFDQNGDSKITAEEFSTTYDGKEYTSEDAFSRIDVDRSGDLNEEELDNFNSENEKRWYDKLKETTDNIIDR